MRRQVRACARGMESGWSFRSSGTSERTRGNFFCFSLTFLYSAIGKAIASPFHGSATHSASHYTPIHAHPSFLFLLFFQPRERVISAPWPPRSFNSIQPSSRLPLSISLMELVGPRAGGRMLNRFAPWKWHYFLGYCWPILMRRITPLPSYVSLTHSLTHSLSLSLSLTWSLTVLYQRVSANWRYRRRLVLHDCRRTWARCVVWLVMGWPMGLRGGGGGGRGAHGSKQRNAITYREKPQPIYGRSAAN
jgi:hypothetical protein